jgi:hypothetical protein
MKERGGGGEERVLDLCEDHLLLHVEFLETLSERSSLGRSVRTRERKKRKKNKRKQSLLWWQ